MASLIGRARRKLLLRLSQAERLMAMPVFVAGTTFLSPVVDGEMCCVVGAVAASRPWIVDEILPGYRDGNTRRIGRHNEIARASKATCGEAVRERSSRPW